MVFVLTYDRQVGQVDNFIKQRFVVDGGLVSYVNVVTVLIIHYLTG